MNRHGIINYLIKLHGYTRYLEIGVRSGSLTKIVCDHKDGVDPNKKSGANHTVTSDVFFAQLSATTAYDIIFIDGLHVEEAVDKDIPNALNHLAPGGVIVLHDCNPITEQRQRSYEEYLKNRGSWNGTVWRSIAKLRMTRADLCMYTVDTDEGIGILRPGHQELFKFDGELTYALLEQHRKALLALVTVDVFKGVEQRWALRVVPPSYM